MARERDGNLFLEFSQIGAITRVSAIDPVTNTEVTIQGPTSAGKAALTRTAVAKLNYVLNRQRGAQAGGGRQGAGSGAPHASGKETPVSRIHGRGIQV